jgi:trehalose/maltose transport system permease protein
MNAVKTAAFYFSVLLIVVIAVFPFYYAIITSFKTGTGLFEVDYWPTEFNFRNYVGTS